MSAVNPGMASDAFERFIEQLHDFVRKSDSEMEIYVAECRMQDAGGHRPRRRRRRYAAKGRRLQGLRLGDVRSRRRAGASRSMAAWVTWPNMTLSASFTTRASIGSTRGTTQILQLQIAKHMLREFLSGALG